MLSMMLLMDIARGDGGCARVAAEKSRVAARARRQS
jgi:hypothetical protein